MTYTDKILNVLVKQEQSGAQPVFNRSVAKKSFKKIVTNYDGYGDPIHDSIMRAARNMKENGLLKRISKGNYTLSAKGRRVASA